jgi:hypothetical protein
MSAVPVETQRANRTIQLTVDAQSEEILDALARSSTDGNRSAAMRHLLHLYAGRTLGETKEVRVFDVEQWRKPRLSRELASRICGFVREGNLRKDAYTLAGVSGRQAGQWLAKGKSDIARGTLSLFADYVMGLEHAEAELKAEQVAEAKRKGDYKFILSRQFPDQYAERKRTDSTVTHQYNVLIEWENLTLQEARVFAALLRKASPQGDNPALAKGTNAPASALIPTEIIEGEVLELEAGEDESPDASNDESPSTSESPDASEAEAPSLGGVREGDDGPSSPAS